MSIYETRLRAEAETVRCSWCDAEIGERCVNQFSDPKTPTRIPHNHRIRAARAAASGASS